MRARTEYTGTFVCPRERHRRRFRLRAARRWLHVGRFAVLPLSPLGRYVECIGCQSTYPPSVLTGTRRSDDNAIVDEDVITTVLRHVIVAVLGAVDGPMTPSRHRAAVIVMQRYVNRPYAARDLDGDLDDLALDDIDQLEELLDTWSSQLNDRGRSIVLAACAQLTPEDAVARASHRAAVLAIARMLSIPPLEARRVLELPSARAG